MRGVLVTGGSRGLGFAIAKAFVSAGAQVAICAREWEPLETASKELGVLGIVGDVSNIVDAEFVVRTAMEVIPDLSVLVNNAGTVGPTGNLWEIDFDDWLSTVQTNLIGSALMARAMVPAFKRAGSGKLIQISGGGATKATPQRSAYAASKSGVVRLAETLAEELAPLNVDVNSLAPGALTDNGVPPDRAAALAVWMASEQSDGVTSRLIAAQWDPWETLGDWRGILAHTDVYQLRRILPEDRGMDFG